MPGIPEARWLAAPQGVHLSLAVGLPAGFSALAVYWLTGLGPWHPEAAVGLGLSVGTVVWAVWRTTTHQHVGLRLWWWVMLGLTAYVLLAAIDGPPWPRTFQPEGAHLAWFLVAWTQAQVSGFWAGQLAPRARLFQLIRGVPDGPALEARVHEFQLDADFSRGNRAALEASLVVMAVAATALTAFSPRATSALSFVLLMAFWAACVLTGVLLRVYRREMEALMYGHRFTWGDKLAPVGWSALLLVLAAAGATLLMALGGPWWDWSRLGRGLPPLGPPPEQWGTNAPPRPDQVQGDPRLALWAALMALLLHLDRLSALIRGGFLLAVTFLPWAIAVVLAWPLVRWVITGGRDTRGWTRRWWLHFRRQWHEFLAALRRFWVGARADATLPMTPSAPRSATELLARWRRSAPGGAGLPEAVRAFLAVVRWIEPRLTYHEGETTREFLDRLIADQPGVADDLGMVRDHIDAALFAPQGLDSPHRNDLARRVKRIIASPPFVKPPGELS